MKLFTVKKVPVFLDTVTHGTERRPDGETKILVLNCRVQPFDAKLAAAVADVEEWRLGQRWVTFEAAEPGFFDDEDDEAGEADPPAREADMWEDGDEQNPQTAAPEPVAAVAEDRAEPARPVARRHANRTAAARATQRARKGRGRR